MPTDPPGPGALAVILVDDRELRRTILTSFLAAWSEDELVETAAIHNLNEEDLARASLVIANLGGASCTDPEAGETLRRIRDASLGTPLAVISDNVRTEDIIAGFEIGIDGYIPTTVEPQMALQTLQFIKSGGQYFPPAALVAISSGRRPSDGADRPVSGALTGRQREVLRLLREGKSNKAIGRALDLQEATVKVHIRQIMRKLGVSNRTQAALATFVDDDPGDMIADRNTARLTVEPVPPIEGHEPAPIPGGACMPAPIDGFPSAGLVERSLHGLPSTDAHLRASAGDRTLRLVT